MKKIFIIWFLLLFCVVFIRDFTHAEDLNTKIASRVMSKSEAELRSSMKKLWESRATLLRDYIVSEINDSKESDKTKDKLLKNAGDLGNSIKPYYGTLASIFLTRLLKKDVMLTEKVIKAAKEGNEEALNLTEKAGEEARNLTERAREEALVLDEKGNKEARDLTERARDKALVPDDEDNKKAPDLTEKAKEEALNLTEEAREEAWDLTERAREEALVLDDEGNKEAPDLTEKARERALGLTEKAKGKALDMTERAKDKARVLDDADKDNKEASGLVEKAKEIARELIKKAKEIALDLIEQANEKALARAKRVREKSLELAKKKWYENAGSLAGFLAIPRNQTKEYLTDMLYKHLDLTWGEIEAMLTKDEAKDLDYYEKDKAHMIMFSDVLVDGIVKQFPEKFKN